MDSVFAHIALSLGPLAILAAYQAGNTDDITQSLDELGILQFMEDGSDLTTIEYFFHPLSKIWEKRKTKPPPDDSSHWKSILDDIRGEHETCMYQPSFCCSCIPHTVLGHRCNAIHGFNLWNETSMSY
jgi:hypothetical protein